MTSKKVALLVHACDRYELLFQGFEYFFKQHWDFNIPCDYYFATEEKTVAMPHFTNIKSGKGEWSNRLVKLLDQIDADFILYFQEDMWLNKPVDADFFSQLFALATTENWQQTKLNSSEVFKTHQTERFINGFNIAKIDNQASGYLMSHQVTLWEKSFLKAQLKPNEHPWRNERKGTKRLKKLNPTIFHIDYFAENGKPAINANQATAQRSEYQSISANATLNYNAEPFLEILKTVPELAAYSKQLSYHFEHQITHDGKPKPMKQGIFKQLKNWWRSLKK